MAKKVKKTTKKKKTTRKTTKKKTAKKTSKTKTSGKKTTKKTQKKTSAGKSAQKRTRKRRSHKSGLSKSQLAHFRELLLEKRRELVGDVNSMELEALRKSRMDATGDLSSMPIHMADIGTDNYEQEFALGLMDSERKLLNEINAALDRIDQGTYGICEGTGESIPLARLEANPWARYTVKYAEMVEKGLVEEGEKLYDEDEFEFEDEFEDEEDLDEEEDLEEDDYDEAEYFPGFDDEDDED